MIVKLLLIAVFAGFYWAMLSIGMIESVIQPFTELPDRVQLYGYVNYAALVASNPMCFGGIALGVYQLIYKKAPAPKYGVAYAMLIIASAVLSFFPRYHLGWKVDQVGYVKCEKESRTSSRSSWRIYAKDISLCKESSGIAGG